MFAQFLQLEDDYFTNVNYNNNITCLMPSTELIVYFRTNGQRDKKPCIVYAERMDTKGLIQIRVTEKADQRKMYIATVDSNTYQVLKQDQSLHVTFAGFIENMERILQDCQAGKLHMHLVQLQRSTCLLDDQPIGEQDSTLQYQLQFEEMRPFKNLVYLCLPAKVAPLNVVLYYISNLLAALQKKSGTQEHHNLQLQHELQQRQRHIEQLDAETASLRQSLLDNIKALNERHSEEMQKMQDALRAASEQRQHENESLRKKVGVLQNQLEKLNEEKAQLHNQKLRDEKRIESLNEDLNGVHTNLTHLKKQNEQLYAEISSLKNVERKNEMHLSDARKQISELQDKLKKCDKAKADIVAALEAEKNISQTKRQALELATEEISKANEIIVKKSIEISKLKKTVEWRTEVALQQEKSINEKENLLQIMDEEIRKLHKANEQLKQDVKLELQTMRKFADSLEQKYSKEIRNLQDKLACFDKENLPFPRSWR